MIDEEEFYRRFNQVVPGESVIDVNPMAIESEIYFEHLSMDGLEEMHRYSTDERLYEFFEFAPFDSIEMTRAYIEKLQKRTAGHAQRPTAMYWFVRRNSDNYLIGTASLVDLNYPRKSIEWGYGVDPKLWGGGYILKIQEHLKEYTFQVLELNRLYGKTMIENKRTISSVLAAGMRHEGNLRDFYCKNGVFHDAWQYSMLRRDFFQAANENLSISTKYSIDDVVAVVSSVLTDEEVNFETSMSNSFTWDSFSHMLIMIGITEKMGITLSPSEVARATSVKVIFDLVLKRHS